MRTRSPEETQTLGERLGRLLEAFGPEGPQPRRGQGVVALFGELGVGKTCLIQGIARGLGVTGYVPSPTFTLIREHHGRVPVYHVDLYRLERPEELEDLGLEEILDREGIVLVEWAEKAAPYLPEEHLQVEMRFGEEDDEREIVLTPFGDRYRRILEAFLEESNARPGH